MTMAMHQAFEITIPPSARADILVEAHLNHEVEDHGCGELIAIAQQQGRN
jgi:hypothetical protein